MNPPIMSAVKMQYLPFQEVKTSIEKFKLLRNE